MVNPDDFLFEVHGGFEAFGRKVQDIDFLGAAERFDFGVAEVPAFINDVFGVEELASDFEAEDAIVIGGMVNDECVHMWIFICL